MERHKATKLLRDGLNQYGLTDWSVRLNQNPETKFLGLCSYKDKCIILSAHHVDIHPEPDVINTIWHEIAHALTPGHGHNDTWATKAREIGCDIHFLVLICLSILVSSMPSVREQMLKLHSMSR